MMFGDRFFTHVATESGLTEDMLQPAGNMSWRMETPALHNKYRELVDVPDSMPPFCRGCITGSEPLLKMHPLIGRDEEETKSITYVRQGNRARFWIKTSFLPSTYLNAIGSFRGKALTELIGHPALESCTITNVLEMSDSMMVGFAHA